MLIIEKLEDGNVVNAERTHPSFLPQGSHLISCLFWGMKFLHCCDHTLCFLVKFFILTSSLSIVCDRFLQRYFMLLLIHFVVQFYRNLPDLLSISRNLDYFQIFSIVNNAMTTALWIKCFYVFHITPLGWPLSTKLSKASLFWPLSPFSCHRQRVKLKIKHIRIWYLDLDSGKIKQTSIQIIKIFKPSPNQAPLMRTGEQVASWFPFEFFAY